MAECIRGEVNLGPACQERKPLAVPGGICTKLLELVPARVELRSERDVHRRRGRSSEIHSHRREVAAGRRNPAALAIALVLRNHPRIGGIGLLDAAAQDLARLWRCFGSAPPPPHGGKWVGWLLPPRLPPPPAGAPAFFFFE